MRKKTIAGSLAVLLLGGCSLTPHYHRPAASVAPAWPKELRAGAGAGQGAAKAGAQIAWEDFYTSPQMRKVIALGLANNRDLRQAALNVQAFQARYRIQHADLLPEIDAAADGSIQRLPADVSTTGQSGVFRKYSVTGAATSYELDLFGRVRSLNSKALQTYFASQQAQRAAQITLVANIAVAFLTLETDRQRLALSKATLANYRDALSLVTRGEQVGTGTELDRRQEATLVAQTEAEVQRATRLVDTDLNALRLLVGTDLPKGFDDGFSAGGGVLAHVPAGLPADLLERRPDILEAEHKLMAANADIGAARAAFFPQITLTGSGGSASAAVSDLFDGGQGTWSFVPHISLPIFTGGRLKGNLNYAKVTRDIKVAAYQKAIQTAFREVCDGLAARATYSRQLSAQHHQVEEAKAYLGLAEKGYRAGVRDYLVVLDAQRTVFAAQQQYLIDHLAQRTGEIHLYQALGGGWSRVDTAGNSAGTSDAPAPAPAADMAAKAPGAVKAK